jgi:hypothetical protein
MTNVSLKRRYRRKRLRSSTAALAAKNEAVQIRIAGGPRMERSGTPTRVETETACAQDTRASTWNISDRSPGPLSRRLRE